MKWKAKRSFIHPVTGLSVRAGDEGDNTAEEMKPVKNLIKFCVPRGQGRGKAKGKQVGGPPQNKALSTKDLKGKG